MSSNRQITVHADWPPEYLLPRTIPSRFHVIGEPVDERDGHQHKYSARTLLCETTPRCRKRAPMHIARRDGGRAANARLQRFVLGMMLDADYPAVLPEPEPPLLFSFQCQADWSLSA